MMTAEPEDWWTYRGAEEASYDVGTTGTGTGGEFGPDEFAGPGDEFAGPGDEFFAGPGDEFAGSDDGRFASWDTNRRDAFGAGGARPRRRPR